jgi:homoserine kinase
MRSRPLSESLRVRAPATTANLGPGFDCAAVALDLWNELEVSPADGEPLDRDHLGVRAFARLAAVEGRRFVWTSRIPRARGLGSSAAVIALGLLAGALLEGAPAEPADLFAFGLELEGHGDNLAAALAGGVCLSWERRLVRIADRPPAVPIAVIPEATIATAASRASLPATVPHADAAFTAGRAALLGAALANGSPELFAQALADRLHEPYREAAAPLLDAVRRQLPAEALGATLSGSGPTVILWAREEAAAACAAELETRFPAERVLRLRAAGSGAAPVAPSADE